MVLVAALVAHIVLLVRRCACKNGVNRVFCSRRPLKYAWGVSVGSLVRKHRGYVSLRVLRTNFLRGDVRARWHQQRVGYIVHVALGVCVGIKC